MSKIRISKGEEICSQEKIIAEKFSDSPEEYSRGRSSLLKDSLKKIGLKRGFLGYPALSAENVCWRIFKELVENNYEIKRLNGIKEELYKSYSKIDSYSKIKEIESDLGWKKDSIRFLERKIQEIKTSNGALIKYVKERKEEIERKKHNKEIQESDRKLESEMRKALNLKQNEVLQ